MSVATIGYCDAGHHVVYVNGKLLTDDEVHELQNIGKKKLPDGNYTYNRQNGLLYKGGLNNSGLNKGAQRPQQKQNNHDYQPQANTVLIDGYRYAPSGDDCVKTMGPYNTWETANQKKQELENKGFSVSNGVTSQYGSIAGSYRAREYQFRFWYRCRGDEE